MPKNAIKSIIFDMDGTLLDSSYAMLQSVNYVRSTLHLPPLNKEFLEYHINALNQNLAMLFYETKEYNPTHRALFKEHYLANANLHVKLYDGVLESLDSLKQKDIKLYIATNASDFFAINMLRHQNILEYFDLVVGANCVPKPKPNPDMLIYINEKTQIPLSQTLLVGDSIKDELAAKNANVGFVFANWGYGSSSQPQKSIDNLLELVNLV